MLTPSIFSNHFVDNVFDDFFENPFWGRTAMLDGMSTNAMKTDIRELEDSYQIDMELPGYAKEDVKGELKDGYLTISATHTEEKEDKDDKEAGESKKGKYLRRERYYGSYQRSFYVGDAVTEQDIKAKFKDGILTITVPKMEKKPEVNEKKFISIEG